LTAAWRDFSYWGRRHQLALHILVAVACLALGVFAQLRFDRDLIDRFAYVAYALSGLLFALAFGNEALERAGAVGQPLLPQRMTVARSLGVVSALLGVALLGCLDFGGNRFRPLGFLVWVGGLLLCLFYLCLSGAPSALGQRLSALFALERPLIIPRIWLGVAIAACVGAVLRLHQLDAIPADIGWDLPYNYTDTLTILNGEYPIFFPANQGREGLFFYLIALVSRFAPLSHFSIKLTSAVVGIGTIPALFLLGRRLFNPSVGLVAAFFLAVNRWHVVLSRSGFRVSLLPLFTILLLHAVVRALQSERPFDFAVAGLVIGLGLYTYSSYVFAVLAVFAGFAFYTLSVRRSDWRGLFPMLLCMVAVAVVVFAPLGRFALEYPGQYLQRIGLQTRLLTADPNRPQMTWPLFLENVRTSLLMYHVYGDHNVRFNVPFLRHFGFVSAVLLVPGLFYTVRRWRQGHNSMLLLMFFFLIVPMTLAMFPHEMPNIFRAAGTIGPGLVMVAVSLVAVASRVRKLGKTYPPFDFLVKLGVSVPGDKSEFVARIGRRGLLRLLPALVISLLLVTEYRETHRVYFYDFVSVLPDRQNVSIAKEMAKQIEAYGYLESCYIKVWPHWFDGRALQTYLRKQYSGAWNPEFNELALGQPPLSSIDEHGMFILHPADAAGLQALSAAFPKHVTMVHYLPDRVPAFVSVYVEH
jgi:hypothetical protein